MLRNAFAECAYFYKKPLAQQLSAPEVSESWTFYEFLSFSS
jgi:hypothetical protein